MHYSSNVPPGVIRRSHDARVLVPTQTPFPSYDSTHQRERDSRWDFGQRVNGKWQRLIRLPEQPYSLDLTSHAGIIVGLSEEGVHMSQLRLAFNAARHGWKVVMFDPHSQARKAAEFVAAMRQAGTSSTYVFPGADEREATGSNFTSKKARENWRHSHLATPPDVHESTPRRLNSPPTNAPYESANAMYFGLNVWEGAQDIRYTAKTLLSDFARFLGTTGTQHVLLLIEHPTLFFSTEEICPLFALLEQAQGSMFISARSVTDFGIGAPRLLRNARTLITHRCNTTLPFEPYVSLPQWSHHERVIRQLAHNECFVIHAGQATHVHINPVSIDADERTGTRVHPRPSTSSPGSALPLYSELDSRNDKDNRNNELDDLLTDVFGSGNQDEEKSEQMVSLQPETPENPDGPVQEQVPKECIRLADLLSDDLACLRNALSLLDRKE